VRIVRTEDGFRILSESSDQILLEIQFPRFILTEDNWRILSETGEPILLEVQNDLEVAGVGIAALPAIGSGLFNARALIFGVIATAVIGDGTIEITGDVFVYGIGVSANAIVGAGTIEGAQAEIVGGGRPWRPVKWRPYPFKPQVVVTAKGVSAQPRIGRGKLRTKKGKEILVYAGGVYQWIHAYAGEVWTDPPPRTQFSRNGVRSRSRIGQMNRFDAWTFIYQARKPRPQIGRSQHRIEVDLFDEEILALLDD
jgi:hypothetical protein